jgi:hypothetical protein
MSEEKSLCPTCTSSVMCNTWGEVKCKVHKRRIYGYKTMTACGSYKKRPKDFKEPKCQCKDCLKNATLVEEDM